MAERPGALTAVHTPRADDFTRYATRRAMKTHHSTLLAGLLLVACSCGSTPPTTTTTTPPETAASASSLTVELSAPGLDRVRVVSAALTDDAPLVVTGCVMPESAPCEESMRVVLDDDAREELQALLDDVAATPRCEPDGIFPGDRDYTLSVEGGATYAGHIPADPAQMAARTGGPCRADARLAWWIARWLMGATRSASENPASVSGTVDTSSSAGPRFVSASIDLSERTGVAVVGCTSSVRGTCRGTTRVALDAPALARLSALLEDVRSEPCHVPFPSGATLAVEAGLVYDGPCGADADLAWWMATQLDPNALTGH